MPQLQEPQEPQPQQRPQPQPQEHQPQQRPQPQPQEQQRPQPQAQQPQEPQPQEPAQEPQQHRGGKRRLLERYHRYRASKRAAHGSKTAVSPLRWCPATERRPVAPGPRRR
mmetsp:Transcript_67861/g.180673  ORF Transcript_67861/g.180673 Transcript_67861/m.180673 type:complete len:111 (+) Transcript_67861:109-441(+)